jgi:ubiquinone/menaquinone biosynthesis C-methylase UbiE
MSQINIPVSWFLGSYDAWIDPASVRELMGNQPSTSREILELPVGHIPLNGEEAFICFSEVMRRIWRFLYNEQIDPVPPNLEEVKRTRQLEWARTPRIRLQNHQSYWKTYMLGDGPSSACYDVFEFFDEYRSFMKHQIDLLDIQPGQSLADMGTGIGNLPCFMLEKGGKNPWKLSNLTLVDFVPELLTKAQGRMERLAQRSRMPLPPTVYRQVNLQMSPLRTLQRFLRGEFFGYDPLKGLLQGLSDYSVEAWKRLADWRLHGLLRGRLMTQDDREFMASALPPVERQVLTDFNRIARFVQGQSQSEDFVGGKEGGLQKLKLEAIRPWNPETLSDALPFESGSFDRIACSLVLSYLDNPAETLTEFVRCLKPGGRIVFSSMMPDVDTGRIYAKALRKLESNQPVELPEGFTRASLTDSIRAHINSGAGLLQMAEEMQFTFFSKEDLRKLAERSGLARVESFPAFGDRPQAFISVGYKP